MYHCAIFGCKSIIHMNKIKSHILPLFTASHRHDDDGHLLFILSSFNSFYSLNQQNKNYTSG